MEINPEYSLERQKLKVKLRYFGHLMQRADSLEKTLIWERLKQEEKRVAEDETIRQHHGLSGHESEQTLEGSGGQRAWCAAFHGAAKSRT